MIVEQGGRGGGCVRERDWESSEVRKVNLSGMGRISRTGGWS